MGVLASVNCYTTRVNLSVALVVMVNSTWITKQAAASGTVEAAYMSPCADVEVENDTEAEVCIAVRFKF